MFLRILEPEAVGTRLHFEFRPDPKHPETVTGTAEVAFRRETYGGPGRPPGMGVRFLALTPEGSELVSRLTGDEIRVPVRRVPEATKGALEESNGGEGSVGSASSDEPTEEADRVEPPEGSPVELQARRGWEDPEDGGLADGASDRFWPRLALGLILVSIPVGIVLWGQREPAARPAPGPDIVTGAPATWPTPSEEDREGLTGAPGGGHAEFFQTGGLDEPVPVEASPTEQARRVREILWEKGPSSLVVVLRGDGSFEEGQATYSHIGGERPRGVIRIREMQRASAGLRLTPESPLVTGIRTGYHAAGREEGELHVVLDLADSQTRITGIVGSGTDLLVYLGRK